MEQEYFDENSLKEALMRAETIKLTQIPPEDELNHCFSGRFRRKMKKLLKEQQRTFFRKKVHPWMNKAAVIVLLIAGLGLGMTLSVDAYRARLVNFIVEIYHDFTLLLRDGDMALDMDGADFVEPEHIPERFTLYERNETGDALHIFYITEENEVLSYHQTSNRTGSTTLLDTEDADVFYIEIDGKEIMVIEKRNHIMYVWEDNYFSYLISGYVTREEIDAITESVIKNRQ